MSIFQRALSSQRISPKAAGVAVGSALLMVFSSAGLAAAAPSGPTPAPAAATAPAGEFSGTVALSNCSGSIVRWESSKSSDLAMMLTNGHCYDFMAAGQAIIDQPETRSVTLLKADGSPAGTVTTTTLMYATMTKTDVALYRLSQTYQQLQDQYAVPAITVASSKASPKDQAIKIVSGYWTSVYTCNLNGFVYRLLEYHWTWNKSLRYSDDGCHVIGGTSGSPVLDSNRVQIGINNTINEDGQRCTLNNPCEKNRKGDISVHQNRGYGQQTWFFYTCLSGTTLDFTKKGCKLPS